MIELTATCPTCDATIRTGININPDTRFRLTADLICRNAHVNTFDLVHEPDPATPAGDNEREYSDAAGMAQLNAHRLNRVTSNGNTTTATCRCGTTFQNTEPRHAITAWIDHEEANTRHEPAQ